MTDVDFVYGITFYLEATTKLGRNNREREKISRSRKKTKCIPSKDQLNCFTDKKYTSKIFMNTYSLWDLDPAFLMTLNYIFDRDPLSKQFHQKTTHQPGTALHPLFSSLRTMDTKSKGLHVMIAFFQRKHLPGGRVMETVATV